MGIFPIVARSLAAYNERSLHRWLGDKAVRRKVSPKNGYPLRWIAQTHPKGEGVGMTDKRNALLLSLIEQGIHYIEEGDAKLFLVVTRSEERDTFDFFLRTAKTEDEAKIQSVKSGEVVMIHRFAEIFAKMLDLKDLHSGRQDLLM
jgi:hypothetical protein